MTADPLDRFTLAADSYARHRPSYPTALIDWVVDLRPLTPGARVLDLGCGTGISSRLFAERGFRVSGVDGNQAMLRHAAAAGGAHYLRGDVGRLPTGPAAADLVVSAQAFHWFDHAVTFVEIDRVLTPGGFAAAFWNMRRPGPFPDAYEAALLEFSEEYLRVGEPKGDERLRQSLAGRPFRETAFAVVGRLPWETVIGRARSASYVARGVKDKAGFEAALRRGFDQHQRDGRVEVPLETVVIAWPRA